MWNQVRNAGYNGYIWKHNKNGDVVIVKSNYDAGLSYVTRTQYDVGNYYPVTHTISPYYLTDRVIGRNARAYREEIKSNYNWQYGDFSKAVAFARRYMKNHP